jgi:glycosyltransferase involved in cell wall biosynthesis
LAHAVEQLIEDANFRASLGQAAQARVRQKFSTGAIIPRYEALYRKQLKNSI